MFEGFEEIVYRIKQINKLKDRFKEQNITDKRNDQTIIKRIFWRQKTYRSTCLLKPSHFMQN
jgi:hypothetical protein